MADSTSDTPVNTSLNPTNPSSDASGSADVKPAIKISLKKSDAPSGIPTAKVVDNLSASAPASINLQKEAPAASAPASINLQKEASAASAPASINLQKEAPAASAPASSTIQLKKPASTAPTIQLKKPASATPTIQLKKPESSAPTVQLKKPEGESGQAKKVGEAPVPPERKLTLKLKNQPSKPQELPRNIIPGLNIPTTPPPTHKDEEQKNEAAEAQQAQPPVAEPVQTQTPVPEAAADGKKKKGKLPKVKKQPAPSSADEPNWFFLTLSCLVLIAVCFIAYILFAQYMNMYEEMQIPVPGFLMPK